MAEMIDHWMIIFSMADREPYRTKYPAEDCVRSWTYPCVDVIDWEAASSIPASCEQKLETS